MPYFRITVAYDGTDYVGWQRQASGASIQGLLEEALRALSDDAVTVIGAGRTDAGVHALGQVAAFSLSRTIAPDVVVRALNARLPDTVRVVSADEAPADFNPRFAARSKTYRYRIWNGDVVSPFERRYTWHVPGTLEVDAMQTAARLLEGRHDFAAFQASGSDTARTERTVYESAIGRSAIGDHSAIGDSLLFTYTVAGDGFLRHMVRAIVGTLVEIGRGRRPAGWIGEVLASRDRSLAGPTAPAAGLFLVRVDY